MKRAFVLALAFIFLSTFSAASQTKRRTTQKKPAASTSFVEKQQAEIRAGRQQVAAQIKNLTQFLYLFGGITKGIETAEQVSRSGEQSSVGMPPDRIEQNKIKLKDTIKSIRTGLDQLESSFKLNPVLQTQYPALAGVAKLGQTAEGQAAANNFDQAGRTLVTVVNKLTDTLVTLH